MSLVRSEESGWTPRSSLETGWPRPPMNDHPMEAVTILRELWRRRALVAAVAIVSILVGFAIAYTISFPPHSRKFEVGIASGRILVDTPDSQVVDVQPKGSGTLGIRAGVLANLMTEGDVKAAIARRAGLRPNQLRAGVEVEGELPPVIDDATGDADAHLLITSPATNPDGTPLPIIDIQTQAPGSRDAARLAEAAVTGLNDYLDSKASGEEVSDAKRLQLTGLGPPEVHEQTRGPSRMAAAVIAIFVFLVGCAAILVGFPLARAWRAAATTESEESPSEPAASKNLRDSGARVATLPSQAAAWWARVRRWVQAPAVAEERPTPPKKLVPVAESGSLPTAAEAVDDGLTRSEEPRANGDGSGRNGDELTASNRAEPTHNGDGQGTRAGSATVSS